MKTIYTLITYIPGEQGWHDRCGDYQSGTESECQIHYFNDPILAGEALGNAWFSNSDGENTLLINGVNPDDWYCILSDEEGKLLENEIYEINDIADKKRDELSKEKIKKIEEEKVRKAQEQKLKELRSKKQQEDAEKQQLSKLLAKYGN